MKFLKDRQTLYCFSPAVMVATFVIELVLALIIFFRHRTTRFGKLSGFVLVLLAAFQFAEFRICTSPFDTAVLWPRIGFIAITLLPLSGLYMVALVSQKPHFLKLGIASAMGFVLYFILVPKSVTGAICGGNYVIFNLSNDLYRLYGMYYLGFLVLGIWESIEKMNSLQSRSPVRRVLRWLIIGYMSFMAPMGAVYILFPVTRNAVASVMCGFALTFAFILAARILPAYEQSQEY